MYTYTVCIFLLQVKYVMIDDNNNLSSLLLTDEEITDLAVDSPSG